MEAVIGFTLGVVVFAAMRKGLSSGLMKVQKEQHEEISSLLLRKCAAIEELAEAIKNK